MNCARCNSRFPNRECYVCGESLHEPETMKTHTYRPRPLRESNGQNRQAKDIQREIDLMRQMYAERRNENSHRQDTMVGWGLVTAALAVPAIAAIVILLNQ